MKNNITHLLKVKETGLKISTNNKGELFGVFTKKKVTCPACKSKDVVKNGFKYTTPIIPFLNRTNKTIKLKKQSYLCKHCGYSFSPSPKFIQPRKRYSNASVLNIVEDLKTNISMTNISKLNGVSTSTVNRILNQVADSTIKISKKLPENISIDEFQATNKMAFIFTNSDTHELINVLESRKGFFLDQFFSLYSNEEKAKVKTITMDIFKPYFSFVKKNFPNAKIVLDRFHVFQNISRPVNKARISVMKTFGTKSHKYLMFKKFWKIYLKDTNNLSNKRTIYIKKLGRRLSAYQISEYLLTLDPTLANVHHFLQRFYHAMNSKNKDFLELVLNEGLNNEDIKKYLETQILTTLECLPYIDNSFQYKFNNGHIEGLINKIKTLKKNAYGFRSFENYRRRILLHCNVAL